MPTHTCPGCGHDAKGVPAVTLEHLLTPDALAALHDGDVFLHCAQPGCDVAYFVPATGQTIDKRQVTVRIGTKESEGERPVCYCFGHSWASIEAELERTGTTDVVESIAAHCKAGDDRCEEKNPQGSCCLGNVRRVVQESRAKLGLAEEATKTADCCGSDAS